MIKLFANLYQADESLVKSLNFYASTRCFLFDAAKKKYNYAVVLYSCGKILLLSLFVLSFVRYCASIIARNTLGSSILLLFVA